MVLAATDFRAAAFSDQRLHERFRILLADLDSHPGCSLPQACRSAAALKAAYRFFAHPDTSVENLLPAFVLPSARRAARGRLVLAVHDSASFNFSSLRHTRGLGFINDMDSVRGLHLHSSLLLDEDCILVGIAHLHFWTREDFRSEDDPLPRQLPIEEKESFKWLIGVRATAAALTTQRQRPRVIHVMDREGDIHEVFAEVRRLGHGAVIRCCQDRRVEGDEPQRIEHAKQRVAASKSLGTMPLQVPRQDRGYRVAEVEVRAREVRLRPEQNNQRGRRGRRPLKLWLIEVREISTPPAAEKAAVWWLWTTVATRKLKQVRRVLRIYRARWRVEEYHRMMKTGCQVESLRLGDVEKLKKVIAMKAWVATRVVRIRDEVKHDPRQDCSECFSEEEWKLLWLRQHQRAWQKQDGTPSLAEVVKWLGGLGGHQGRKGDGLPGAELLSRGLYALDLLLEGQRLSKIEQAGAEANPSTRHPPSHQHPRG